MSKLYSIVDFLREHKNWVVIIVCALFVGFLDSNSIWERHYVWQSIKELKAEIKQLEESYNEDTRQLEELRSNPRQVVRIAREKYLMTRPGEDLFVIQPESGPVGEQVGLEEQDSEDPVV